MVDIKESPIDVGFVSFRVFKLRQALRDCQVFDKNLYDANIRKMLEVHGEFDEDDNYDDHGDGAVIQNSLYCIGEDLPIQEIEDLCSKLEGINWDKAYDANNMLHWLYEVLCALEVGQSLKDRLKTLSEEDKQRWVDLAYHEGFDKLSQCLDEVSSCI